MCRGGGSREGESSAAKSPPKNLAAKPLIGINIFGSSGVTYFSLGAWREIIEALTRHFGDYQFIFTTTKARFDAHAFDFAAKNIAIFVNDDDVLNLVALTKRLDALVSVDTGNVHIADNLQTPTIALYTRRIFRRWSGGSYGGRFAGFIVDEDSSEGASKERFLAFVKEKLPGMIH